MSNSEINTTAEIPPFETVDNPYLLAPGMLCVVACTSQAMLIVIARGLQGDYSARTFLWVQSLAQITQQLGILQLALCGALGDNFCIVLTTDTECKVVNYLIWFNFLLPDWLAVPVALDRINALKFPVWYKKNCTQKNAWLVISPIFVFVLILLLPKALFNVAVAKNICVTGSGAYDNFLSLSGLPAVVIIAIATLILSALIRNKKKEKEKEDEAQQQMTVALMISSATYAVFGTIQYLLMSYAYINLNSAEEKEQFLMTLGLAQVVGSFGIVLRIPVLLYLKPMRAALKRGLRI